jgi:hypothetical protein
VRGDSPCALGLRRRASRRWASVPSLSTVDPVGLRLLVFGCPQVQSELPRTFVDRGRFPSRPALGSGRWERLSPFLRYNAPIGLLLGHRLSSFVPTAFRSRGAQQISPGKIHEFHDHLVANTATSRTDFGLHRWGPAHPTWLPYGTLLSLDPVVHLWLPPDIPSQARRRLHPFARAVVLHSNALASSVSGSLRRAPGLDFHLLLVESC